MTTSTFEMWTVAGPVLFAIFVWWFSTGMILLLDGLPRKTFRWSLVLSSAIAVAALVGLHHTAGQTTLAGAYCAFACALLVWGWHELSFLTGWITGPRKIASPPGASEGQRFVHAVNAILWHELAIIGMGLFIIALTWDAPNQVGMWTFVVLWSMRTSAKLNLFFGVRNLSEEFLPPHLTYMLSFFRRRAMNAVWPVCVGAATVVLVWMVQAALAPTTPAFTAVGLWLAGTLLAMAILEHALLVLPVPSTALWRWAMRKPAAQPNPAATALET